MTQTGLVFDIEKFAIHDGPGIRTTVFLKGCPLHCQWCHNPESQRPQTEIFFTPEKCIGCGWCFRACPAGCHVMRDGCHVFDRAACRHCGRCAEKCYAEALEKVGREMTTDEVLAEVMKDKMFYDNSNGGITLSGGEPLAQFAFTRELLRKAQTAGLHVCLETCGYAPWEHLRELVPLVDLFLFDVKAMDPERHREFTGQDNRLILENLRRLDAAGAAIVLRCPLVPGVNDDQAHLAGIAELANALSQVQEIHLEPYHPLGVGKSARLGREARLPRQEFTEEEQVEDWLAQVRSRTTVPVRKN